MKEGKRIVVMGGSFNLPTLAHYKLMKEADRYWNPYSAQWELQARNLLGY